MLLDWLLVVVGLVLTLGRGLFVASEFALVNLDRSELEAPERDGEPGLTTTTTTTNALRITSPHRSGARLGITVTTLLTGLTFEPAVSRLLKDPLTALGVPAGAVPVIGTVTGLVLATLFSLVVGELVPKDVALALPLRTARLVLPFQTMSTAVFRPLILLFNGTANALVELVGEVRDATSRH
ncbi:protein of unknown function DUF21 [Friedmanniella luteola]|uniref:CNNM transmembrane domain-containing protein n=1 Tax=Friedmanniella luteola TaxID=546871 RepID=A0A1H1ZBD1_9ACTN|nr:CNNM domain-containing protein [Friedmanniella luteola]SDT30857.1 protein of unknown function DUF21 [Friedmanniella luteola]